MVDSANKMNESYLRLDEVSPKRFELKSLKQRIVLLKQPNGLSLKISRNSSKEKLRICPTVVLQFSHMNQAFDESLKFHT